MKTKQLKSNSEVLGDILSRRDLIQTALTDEDVDVYLFLLNHFSATGGKISDDCVFQFLFRSYYRLDNAGLTKEFKLAYFKMMEECFAANNIDIRRICVELSKHKNFKNQNTLQFSFTSKLVAMIDPGLPLFDLYVGKMFGFSPPACGRSIDRRLDAYIVFYERLQESIRWLTEQQEYVEFQRTLCNKVKNWNRLSITKRADFILWTAGKLRVKGN